LECTTRKEKRRRRSLAECLMCQSKTGHLCSIEVF